MSDLCSVLCVSYNHAKFAAAGLQSIFEQTYRNIEIVVLDDGSPDNSVEVIEKALTQSPFPTKFIKQVNSGNVPANFNKVLTVATGKFVTMMSLDDLLMPDCVENAVRVLETDESIVFSANTGQFEINDDGQRKADVVHLPLPQNRPKTSKDLVELEFNSLGCFYVQGQVFRRDTLLSVGGFDESMIGDDIILRTRLFQHMARHPELKFSLGDNVVLSYRKHGNNLHRNVFRQIKAIVQWKEKYFPERAYPALFHDWLGHFIDESIRLERTEDIERASQLSPELARLIEERLRVIKEHQSLIEVRDNSKPKGSYKIPKVWRHRLRKLKRTLKRFSSIG